MIKNIKIKTIGDRVVENMRLDEIIELLNSLKYENDVAVFEFELINKTFTMYCTVHEINDFIKRSEINEK